MDGEEWVGSGFADFWRENLYVRDRHRPGVGTFVCASEARDAVRFAAMFP